MISANLISLIFYFSDPGGIPIAICLGLSSICAIFTPGTSLTIVATNMYSGISKFLLLAIPFFVLSGNIMAKREFPDDLLNLSDTCVGHHRGGIAIVCVIVACFFGAISGSGPATVAALGAVLIPAMIERGRFFRTFFYSAYGNRQLHCHCYSTEYCFCCICVDYRGFHCRHVFCRNCTRDSHGRCSGSGCYVETREEYSASSGKNQLRKSAG